MKFYVYYINLQLPIVTLLQSELYFFTCFNNILLLCFSEKDFGLQERRREEGSWSWGIMIKFYYILFIYEIISNVNFKFRVSKYQNIPGSRKSTHIKNLKIGPVLCLWKSCSATFVYKYFCMCRCVRLRLHGVRRCLSPQEMYNLLQHA